MMVLTIMDRRTRISSDAKIEGEKNTSPDKLLGHQACHEDFFSLYLVREAEHYLQHYSLNKRFVGQDSISPHGKKTHN